MRGLGRWMLTASIGASMAGLATASENPAAPDAGVAKAAVAQAESAVRQAQAELALWTSAEEALRKARRALQEGDAAHAVEQARVAVRHSELGIAQKNYPLFR